MTPQAWLFLGTLITGLASLAGVMFTVSQAREATRAKNRTELARLEVEGRGAEFDQLRAVIAQLNDHIERVQGWHDECESRCDECVGARDELRDINRTLHNRIRDLERRLQTLETDDG